MDYKWSAAKRKFINEEEVMAKKPDAIELLTAMHSEDDSTAIKAFVKLTRYDTMSIDEIPVFDFKEDMNDALPLFQEPFLKILSRYYAYSSQNNLSLELQGRTKYWFDQLSKENSPFEGRYQLENEVIKTATPDEISALEYWFLVNEENWELTFSAGRIIDKFYSFHWNQIIHDTSQLKHYLKKAALFERLGIIGNCNKYLKKFQFVDEKATSNLEYLAKTAQDADIVENARTASKGIKIIQESIIARRSDANYDTTINDLHQQYKKFANKPHEEYERPLDELIGFINFGQIGELILLLTKNDKLDEVYDFLERDFGFPVDLDDSGQVNDFLRLYKKLPYKDLCRHYLDQLGLHYKNADGSLDYQAIYEMLEFDVVDALSGGGGGHRETGVYLLIKLLEFKFKTTLGFPRKLCNGGGIYGCSSDDRATEWKKYLVKNKLAKPFTGIPQSISILGR